MKWIVREPHDGGSYLENSMEGLEPPEMSTQRAWLFDSEEAAREALRKATRGHAKTSLVVCRIEETGCGQD